MRYFWNNALRDLGKIGLAYILITVDIWFVFMILIPQLIMFDYSLRPILALRDIGGPKDIWTLKNY